MKIKGDSGGPAVMKIGQRYYQVGAVSYGSKYCDGIYLICQIKIESFCY